jgi:hypothetical protein
VTINDKGVLSVLFSRTTGIPLSEMIHRMTGAAAATRYGRGLTWLNQIGVENLLAFPPLFRKLDDAVSTCVFEPAGSGGNPPRGTAPMKRTFGVAIT